MWKLPTTSRIMFCVFLRPTRYFVIFGSGNFELFETSSGLSNVDQIKKEGIQDLIVLIEFKKRHTWTGAKSKTRNPGF